MPFMCTGHITLICNAYYTEVLRVVLSQETNVISRRLEQNTSTDVHVTLQKHLRFSFLWVNIIRNLESLSQTSSITNLILDLMLG